MMDYIPVIGLEVHIELSTKSKMFCSCPADHFGAKANTQTCPVCLGLPGALPYANMQAIDNTIKFGSALGCEIAHFSKFDRKHYFYPDLPKGYQISQYDLPLAQDGEYHLGNKKIRVRRVHLEEDTGKLVHTRLEGKPVSLVDFNRSGVPLLEMVTEPDFNEISEVTGFLKEIQRIVRYLGISDADMEKGSMRLEANLSLGKKGDSKLPDYKQSLHGLPPYKVELKNINSFRLLDKAISYEIDRQRELLEKGETPTQETRGYSESKNQTFSQRIKEEANDYRYFPEPDIPPIKLLDSEMKKLVESIGELPTQRRIRYKKEFQIPDNYIEILIEDKSRSDYFESACKLAKEHSITPKQVSEVMVNLKLDSSFPEPAGLVRKLLEVTTKVYSTDQETKSAIEQVLLEEKEAVEKYKGGKIEVVGYLIGQVQKILKGSGDPKVISHLLAQSLS